MCPESGVGVFPGGLFALVSHSRAEKKVRVEGIVSEWERAGPDKKNPIPTLLWPDALLLTFAS
jgi:hypothetical protein